MTQTTIPKYDALPLLEGLDVRHAWDVWGRDDVLGSINRLEPARTARAAAGVRTGEVVSLDLPLDVPDPPLFGRQPYSHHVFALNRNEMDDRLDGFHLQASTQWDALCHVRCREHGYWGGRTQDPTDGPNGLGIHHWAQRGLAGRGVLADVSGWHAGHGRSFDALAAEPVTADVLAQVLAWGGVTPEPGDFLCIRFGWVPAYRALGAAERGAYADSPVFAGLQADEAMARYLWNTGFAAICCDNPAVEVVPGDPAVGSLHRRLIPALGFALGEMFDLERLAVRCAALGRREFLFCAAPLHVPNALGSPGNAMALL